MTAILTQVTPYAVVADAWQVYRRAQQIPFPADGAGDLMAAQNRLFSLAEPFASGRVPLAEAEAIAGDVVAALVDAIEDATDNLVAIIEWACGTEAASFAAGDSEGRAA